MSQNVTTKFLTMCCDAATDGGYGAENQPILVQKNRLVLMTLSPPNIFWINRCSLSLILPLAFSSKNCGRSSRLETVGV